MRCGVAWRGVKRREVVTLWCGAWRSSYVLFDSVARYGRDWVRVRCHRLRTRVECGAVSWCGRECGKQLGAPVCSAPSDERPAFLPRAASSAPPRLVAPLPFPRALRNILPEAGRKTGRDSVLIRIGEEVRGRSEGRQEVRRVRLRRRLVVCDGSASYVIEPHCEGTLMWCGMGQSGRLPVPSALPQE